MKIGPKLQKLKSCKISVPSICEQTLGLVKVRDVIEFHQLKLAYEFTKSLLPVDISNLFKWSCDQQTTNLNLISNTINKLALPPFKNVTTGKQTIRYHCAHLWNKFTVDKIRLKPNSYIVTKFIKSIHHFKSSLKKTLQTLLQGCNIGMILTIFKWLSSIAPLPSPPLPLPWFLLNFYLFYFFLILLYFLLFHPLRTLRLFFIGQK